VNTTYNARLNQKFSLPTNIDFQVNANYNGASANAQGTSEGIPSVNIAASRDFFGDNATLSMNVSDLFNSRRRQGTVFIEDQFRSTSDFQWRERQVNLTFTYRFNQKKRNERSSRGGGDFELEG
jgi:autotransporter translocation and assembly factor TamB